MPGIVPPGKSGSGPDVNWNWGNFDWNPISWFENSIFGPITSGVADWLGGLGGDIASGIEGAWIAILKDTWGILEPAIQIALGAVIAFWAIAIWLASSKAGEQAIGAAAFGLAR